MHEANHVANNKPLEDMPGTIAMQAEVEVDRSCAEVFHFWRALENFPKFMDHVKEVRAISDNRYHWRVSGPIGTEMTWDADVSEVVANQRISWRSVIGSTVDNSGSVEFLPLEGNRTCIRVSLSYTPPAGLLGHAVATLFGANPRQQMLGDLERCRALLEHDGLKKDGKLVTESKVCRHEDPSHTVH